MKKIILGLLTFTMILASTSCVIVADDILGTVVFTNTSSTEIITSVELRNEKTTEKVKECYLGEGESITFKNVTPGDDYDIVIITNKGDRRESHFFEVHCEETERLTSRDMD